MRITETVLNENLKTIRDGIKALDNMLEINDLTTEERLAIVASKGAYVQHQQRLLASIGDIVARGTHKEAAERPVNSFAPREIIGPQQAVQINIGGAAKPADEPNVVPIDNASEPSQS